MSRKIYTPYPNLNRIPNVVTIGDGGTGADNQPSALLNLSGITSEDIGQPLGPVPLDETGKFPSSYMSQYGAGGIALIGPTIVQINSRNEYLINNYDAFKILSLQAVSGEVYQAEDKIIYKAPNIIGNSGFYINNKLYQVVVEDNFISKPDITSPLQDSINKASIVNITSSDFSLNNEYVNTLITADDKATDDLFGTSIALDSTGTRMAIGAHNKTVGGITNAGQVYIYIRTGMTWTLESTVDASDKAANDLYGISVSFDANADRLVVGAQDKTVGGVTNCGQVYVYTRTGTVWTEESVLSAHDKTAYDYYGRSVSLDANADRLVVGAHFKTADTVVNSGQVYVYTRSGTVWTLEQVIKAADKAAYDYFGISVSLDSTGTRMAIGAYNKTVGGVVGAGQVYIYTRSGSTWTQESVLSADDKVSNDYFGSSVSLNSDGMTMAVSSQNKTVNSIIGAGQVYIYVLSGITWVLKNIIISSEIGTNDYFGSSVSFNDNNTMLAIGVNSKDNGIINNSGAVYIYDYDHHVSTDWQLSVTPDFSNILQESLVDTVNLTSWDISDLIENSDYYLRCRHNGNLYNPSEWSDFKHFTTKAQFLPTTELAILTASDKAASDNFGVSVSLTADGNILAIGAIGKDISGISDAGQVYIYTRSGTTWVEETIITASDKATSDHFGISVALNADGSILAVGAHDKDVSGLAYAGKVYVYTRSGTTWIETANITASDKAAYDYFGVSVSLNADGSILAVGAHGKKVSGLTDAGQVYIYTRTGSVWTEETTITASDKATGDLFGRSVSLTADGTRLAVGAHGKDISGVTIAGKVYIYTRSGTVWVEEATITAADKAANDYFGISVALTADGTRLAVGVFRKDVSGITDAGKVYIYTRSGTTWIETITLTASDKSQADNFGIGLALTSNESLLAVGSLGRDSGGIVDSGAVYIFY